MALKWVGSRAERKDELWVVLLVEQMVVWRVWPRVGKKAAKTAVSLAVKRVDLKAVSKVCLSVEWWDVQRVGLLAEKKAAKMADQTVERKAGQWAASKAAY